MKQDIKFYKGQIVRIKSREDLEKIFGTVSRMRDLHGQQATIIDINKDRIWIDTDNERFIRSHDCFDLIEYGRNSFIL